MVEDRIARIALADDYLVPYDGAKYINAEVLYRLKQLHQARPRLDRWIDAYFKLEYKLTFALSYQAKEFDLYKKWWGMMDHLKYNRYRLRHIKYNTEVHWENGLDLLRDLQEGQWVRCRVKWDTGYEYFDAFPIVDKKKLMTSLLAEQSLREMPVEMLELITNYVI